MKSILLFILFSCISIFLVAEETCGNYLSESGVKGVCEHVEIDASNTSSLQKGLKLYMNYCFGCHSLKYARYNRLASDLGIPEDLFQQHLLFGDQKMGDLMTVSMDDSDAKEWFGVIPPDLTLESSLKGTDWLYTYLISFYIDESRPLGVNNKVYKNVGMPHILSDMQGDQYSVCKQVPQIALNGGLKQDPVSGKVITQEKCGFLEIQEGSGELTSEEFRTNMKDLTNFLAYMSDPIKEEREYIGKFVILYLLIFTILSYLLYREFKKDLR